MSKNISLLVNSGGSSSQVITLDSNNPAKIKIQDGHKYILKNQDNNHSPEHVTLKRHGNDLHVILEDDTNPAIVIDDYYVSGNQQPLLGIAEDGQLYSYITTDALSDGYALANEGSTSAALGGSSLGDSSYLFDSVEYSDGLMSSWPWFLGAAVIGGMGYAIYDNNEDNEDDDSSFSSSPLQLAIQPESQPVPQSEQVSQTGSEPVSQSEPEPVPLPTPTEVTDAANDTTAPAQPVASSLVVDSQSGSILTGTKLASSLPTFSGEGEPGSVITFMDDTTVSQQIVMSKSGKHLLMADNATAMSDGSHVIGQVVVGADGKWSFTPDQPLAEGQHHITMVAVDKLGNQSAVAELMVFEVDITAPETPIINAVLGSVSDLNSEILLGGNTNDAKPTLNGQSEPGSTVTITDHGEVIGRVIADQSGHWTFTPEVALSEGEHSICVAAVDEAGNGSQLSNIFVFKVDTIAPEQPTISGITDSQNPSFLGEGEPNSTVTIFDNGVLIGQVPVSDEGHWVFTPSESLGNGAHSITVSVTDFAGNVSELSNSFMFTIDIAGEPVTPDEPILLVPAIESVVADFRGELNNGTAVNNPTPTLKGAAEQGSVVTIFDNGILLGSTVADSDGKWSFTPAAELPAGEHVFTAAGNAGIPSTAFTVIVDPELHIHPPMPEEPVVPAIESVVADFRGELNNGTAVNNPTPTLKGAAEQGSVVTIFDNGILLGSTVADSDGKWSFTPAAELPAGEHVFTAAGNVGIPSTAFTVIVDPELHIHPPMPEEPVVPTIESVSDDVGSVQGILSNGSLTDDSTPTLTGKSDSGSVVRVYGNDVLLGSVVTDSSGHWSFTPTSALQDGQYAFTIKATDIAGNVNESLEAFNITIDTMPIILVSINQLIDNVGYIMGAIVPYGVTDDARPEIVGTAKAGSTVKVYDGAVLLGSTIAGSDGQWDFRPVMELADGTHRITAIATDSNGNISQPTSEYEFTVDTVPPSAPTIESVLDDVGSVQGILSSGDFTDDSTPTLTGKSDSGSVVEVYGNGVLLGSVVTDSSGQWNFTPTAPLTDGEHQFHVVSIDAAGNLSVPSGDFVLTVDTIAPEKPLLSINVRVYVDGFNVEDGPRSLDDEDYNPWFFGTGESGSTITIIDNGKVIGQTVADASGKWEFIPQPVLSNGDHDVYATSMDKAGNISQPSEIVTFQLMLNGSDPVVPAIESVVADFRGELNNGTAVNNPTPTLKGAAEHGSVVTIFDNGILLGSTVADSDGKWSFTPAAELPTGEHVFTAAGNAGIPSTAFTVIVDPELHIHPPMPEEPVVPAIESVVADFRGELNNGTAVNNPTPTLKGAAEHGSVVTIFDNGILLGSTVADSDGKWSFTPAAELPAGEHVFTAAGNVGIPSTAFTVIVDPELHIHPPMPEEPVVPTIESVLDDVGSVPRILGNGSITLDATPTLTGKAEKASIVKIYAEANLYGSVVADAETGEWSFTFDYSLPDGVYHFTVTSTDAAGNVSLPSTAFDLIVDIPAPGPGVITILGVEDQVGAVTGNVKSGDNSDDSRPIISGIAGSAGSIIVLYTKDHSGNYEIGSTTVNTDGTWSLQPATPLLPGSNELTIVAVDAGGNSSIPSAAYLIYIVGGGIRPPVIDMVLDDVGMITGSLSKGDVIDDNLPTITGSAFVDGVVTIYDHDVVIGSAIIGVDGKWSFTPTTALADGEHNISVTVTSTIGQITSSSNSFNFVIDTTAPVLVNLVITDHTGAVTGPLTNGDTTDDNKPIFSGKAEASSIVTIYNGIEIIGSTTVDSDGNWIFIPATGLPEGEYQFNVTATDKAGNISGASETVNLDIGGCCTGMVSITRLIDNAGEFTGNIVPNGVTDETRPEMMGFARPAALVKVYDYGYLLGSTQADSNGNWSFTPARGMTQGEHNITAVSIDLSGNVSAPTSVYAFVIDTTPPVAPTIESVSADFRSDLSSGTATNDVTPTLNGVAEKGSTVAIFDRDVILGSAVADSTTGKWSFTPSFELGFGDHAFTAVSNDKAGNESSPSSEFVVIIDADICIMPPPVEPPVLPTIEFARNSTGVNIGSVDNGGALDNNTPPTLMGKAAQGSVVAIYDGGILLGSTLTDSSGEWSFTPSASLPDGQHTFTITATDVSGYVRESSNDFVLNLLFVCIMPPPPELPEETDIVGSTIPNSVVDMTITAKYGDYGDLREYSDKPIFMDEYNSLVFKGKAEAGSIVTVYDGATKLGDTKVGVDGSWIFVPSEAPTAGSHQFTTTVTDSAGNTSVTSDAAVLDLSVINYIEPDLVGWKFNIVAVNDINSELLSSDYLVNDARPTFFGITSFSSNVITIYDGETLLGEAYVQSSGKWNFTPDFDLGEGVHSIVAYLKDPVHNVEIKSSVFEFVVDTVTPVTPTIEFALDDVGLVQNALTSGSSTDDSTPTLTGKAEKSSTVKVYDGGELLGLATADAETGQWSFTPRLHNESHQFTVVSVDKAGNISAPSEAFVLMTDFPSSYVNNLVITSVDDQKGDVTGRVINGDTSDDSRPMISGTGTAGDNVIVYSNDGTGNHEIGRTAVEADGTWSLQSAQLMDGKNQLTAVAVDSTGYVSAPSAPYTIVLDTDFDYTYRVGSPSDDVFLYVGPGDQVIAGAGNDVINLLSAKFGYISGGEGIDTLVVGGHNNLLDLGALDTKLSSVEIFDLRDGGHNTMVVHWEDVLRLGSEELSITGGNKAIVVNGDDSSTLDLGVRGQWTAYDDAGDSIEKSDEPWVMSQSEHQYAGNTYNVWTNSASNVEILVENTVHVMM
ncbi:Ig-like domain-containing protein [Limnobaculum parvum]|uniref:Bacterial Ig-like domain-containing protein n=1 Tax=Limnobaculum parvum TaxID=2172103 RepID=A0A2Y9TZW4_9GAMM|nr:Ig-like domain-containing protein [Limnobaculum parvum]AWH88934.1 hypothetical protein HYN51_10445 [Limnobaculum parvum]